MLPVEVDRRAQPYSRRSQPGGNASPGKSPGGRHEKIAVPGLGGGGDAILRSRTHRLLWAKNCTRAVAPRLRPSTKKTCPRIDNLSLRIAEVPESAGSSTK